jgi:hypothetical protein
VGVLRTAYKMVVKKKRREGPAWRQRHRWEDNIQMGKKRNGV